MFIPPMLAQPFPTKKEFILEPDTWAAEEKIDGIRLGTEVSDTAATLFVEKGITCWSRLGNLHPVPAHLMEELSKFPNCYIDGELYVPGLRSYGATEIVNRPDLRYAVFDILHIEGEDTTEFDYDYRQEILRGLFNGHSGKVHHLISRRVDTWAGVLTVRDEVWARDGEGLILKRRSAPYQMKRSKDFIKIKKLESGILCVIGLTESRGLKNYRGPYAIVVLQDEDGNITATKTKNDEECRKFEKEAPEFPRMETIRDASGRPYYACVNHPAVGKLLRIEYQERTPDGSYRHPRWDRWENE